MHYGRQAQAVRLPQHKHARTRVTQLIECPPLRPRPEHRLSEQSRDKRAASNGRARRAAWSSPWRADCTAVQRGGGARLGGPAPGARYLITTLIVNDVK